MDAHEEYQKSIAKAFIDRQILLDAAKELVAHLESWGEVQDGDKSMQLLRSAIAEAEKGS